MADRSPPQTNGFDELLAASKQVEAGLLDAAKKMLRGFEQRQREFQQNKERIEDDIKRGARLSSGRIPI